MNFKVTWSNRRKYSQPSSLIIPTEKINHPEALGLAGDMTAYGKARIPCYFERKMGKSCKKG